MIFDGRPIAEIQDEELAALVADRVREDQHIEFKAVFETERHPLDFLKEIAALANGGGGYLIVGIRDEEHRAADFVGTARDVAERDATRLRDLYLEHIVPRIEGFEADARMVDGNGLTIVRIPPSIRRPHMVTYERGTHFVCRVADAKREMSYEEIRAAFRDEPLSLQVSAIGEGLVRLVDATERDEAYDRLTSLLEGGGPVLTQTEEGTQIARIARERFEGVVGDEPYYWIAATPTRARPRSLPVDDQGLRDLLRQPPGSRRGGWNMEPPLNQPPTRTAEGLDRGRGTFERLILTENGHMEFWTPLDTHFCWQQSEEEFRTRPVLYPLPVVEYPVSFLRLYRALIDRYELEGTILVQYEYRNLRGYSLRPFHPEAIRYLFGEHHVYTGAQHFRFGPIASPNDFNPDLSGRELLVPFYGAYGYETYQIPFFDEEEQRFIFQ